MSCSASLGKQVRLNRLLNRSSGKLLSIALDHAIAHNVIKGIDHIQKTIDLTMESQPDAITIHKGIARKCFFPYAGQTPFILKCTSFSPYYPGFDGWVADVEEAVQLGADAIAVGCTVGGDDQALLISQLSKFTRTAEKYGMPVVTHIYPKGESATDKDRYDFQNVRYAARAAAELGVDIVKTFYTGDPETYRQVIESCPAMVVVSGGPKLEKLEDVLQMTRDAMDMGAYGVTYGRNIWQRDNMVQAIQALKAIIHEGASVENAMSSLE